MKILQIFGAVVAVHLLAFIFIFASPGCNSGPRNIPTPDATVPTGSSVAPITYNSTYTPAEPQSVDMPASSQGYAVPTRPGSATAVAVTPPPKPTVTVAPVTTYTVVKGDSLWSIAQRNNLSVGELAKANNLGAGVVLQPGNKLIVPGKPGAPAPKDLATTAPLADKAPVRTNGEAVKHTVQSGESLGVIARKYQVTVGELAAANNITDPSRVLAGQQLVIPGFKAVTPKSGPAPVPVAAPAPEPDIPVVTTRRFDISAPPPGQDLDAGLKEGGTEVPTIKVEESTAGQPAN